MPLVPDYDSSEEDEGAAGSSGGLSGGSSGGGGGGSSRFVQGTPQQEKAFTPWSRFVSANEEVSHRSADRLNSRIQGEVAGAKKGQADATDAFGKGIESNYSHWGDSSAPAGGFGEPEKPKEQQGRLGWPEEAEFGFTPQADHSEPASQATAAPVGHAPVTGLVAGDDEKPVFNAPDQPRTRTGLLGDSIDNPKGAKDLEAQLGPDGWKKLLGDTRDAMVDSAGLGSETGVQALLQQQGNSPNSAFDAALINGAGNKAFAETAKSGVGLGDNLAANNMGAQQAWQKLMGDVDTAKHDRSATAEADAFNAKQAAEDAANKKAAAAADPVSVMTIEQILYGGGESFWSELHRAGLEISPADKLVIESADASNTDIPLPTEEFSKNFDYSGGKVQQSWWPAKFNMAYEACLHEYGPKAMEMFRQALSKNPEMLAAYKGMKNPGYMRHQMRAWLESADQHKIGTGKDILKGDDQTGQTKVKSADPGATTYTDANGKTVTSSAEDEHGRNELAKGRPYTDPSGKTWTSLTEWDAAHR